MTIPISSLYPEELDTDLNLFTVHDALRVRLLEDYTPGDTSITVEGDITNFPSTGLITLTEQCSEVDDRAISFFYGSKTDTTFDELEILPNFNDIVKPKKITNVTQNVMAEHHNCIKDAIIAIEEFIGVQCVIDSKPLGNTMEGRINFLRKLVLSPKAWFSVNKNIGLVPLTIEFKDQSFRLGSGGDCDPAPVTYKWDFGDNTTSTISIISVTTEVPVGTNEVIVYDLDGGLIKKTYNMPGIYDVALTVTNAYGEDTVIMPGIINARVAAPEEAVIEIIPRTAQVLTPGTPSGGPYTSPPVIRSVANSLIDITVPTGRNVVTDLSYGGEVLDGNNQPIDPITTYTWNLGDDLTHLNSRSTKASFSVGGIYDLILRTDTRYGSYRITTYENSLNIIEKTNLWLWTGSTYVNSYEYGLISETFKAKSASSLQVSKDDSFLTGVSNETQQKREFNRNNGFAPRSTTASGDQGVGLLFWASGRTSSQTASDETIKIMEYNGFSDTYLSRMPISRPWNWASLVGNDTAYFLHGTVAGTILPYTSPTNSTKTELDLTTLATINSTLTVSNYKNGADELMSNPATYNSNGDPIYGHMSVYRTAWKDSTGYILRNDGVGNFFRLKNFYKTEAIGTNVFMNIRKVPDIAGFTKTEGRLVPLSSGIFFFNNSGSIAAYNDISGVWTTTGPGLNSSTFRALQDSTVIGFDDESNTLLAASDGDHRAYISYDYSPSAFIMFNEADLTLRVLSARPEGTQWQITIF